MGSGCRQQADLLFVQLAHDKTDRFADQARALHYGDTEPRSIRCQSTPREAVELMERGIDIMALPMPAALKETLR